MDGLIQLAPTLIFGAIVLFAARRTYKKAQKQGRLHIGGWLLVLIFGLMVLGPFVGFGRLLADLTSAERQYPDLANLEQWQTYKTATWFCFATITGLSVYAGWGLYFGRGTSVVRRAKILLWIIGPVGSIVMAAVVPALVFGKAEFDPDMVGSLFASVVVAGVWTAYLSKSKRVAAGYGDGVEAIQAQTLPVFNNNLTPYKSWKEKLSSFMQTGMGIGFFLGKL